MRAEVLAAPGVGSWPSGYIFVYSACVTFGWLAGQLACQTQSEQSFGCSSSSSGERKWKEFEAKVNVGVVLHNNKAEDKPDCYDYDYYYYYQHCICYTENGTSSNLTAS